jgi:hypothetical protein
MVILATCVLLFAVSGPLLGASLAADTVETPEGTTKANRMVLVLDGSGSMWGQLEEPIVFDFEDGLQGWELHGSAERIQTQLLGGDWAILGDGLVEGGAAISTVMNLSDIVFISVDQFFVGDVG